jgi:hypothetical protein
VLDQLLFEILVFQSMSYSGELSLKSVAMTCV